MTSIHKRDRQTDGMGTKFPTAVVIAVVMSSLQVVEAEQGGQESYAM